MTKETFERLEMDVTVFDVEDVITTSDIYPYKPGDYEHVVNNSGSYIYPPEF